MANTYTIQSNISQTLKDTLRQYKNCWDSLDPQEREALEVMMVNASYIMTGHAKNRNIWNEAMRPAREISSYLAKEAANQPGTAQEQERALRSVM